VAHRVRAFAVLTNPRFARLSCIAKNSPFLGESCMKRLTCVFTLAAAIGLSVLAAASRAQPSASGTSPPPCPATPGEKKTFNPAAALNAINSGLSLFKQVTSKAGDAAQASAATAQAASSGGVAGTSTCPGTSAGPGNSTGAPVAPAAPVTLAAAGANPGGSTAPAWTPPADSSGGAPAGPLVPAKLPDIGGVHLGMSLAEAQAALQKLYPGERIAPMNAGPDVAHYSVGTLRIGDGGVGNGAGVDLTLPPGPQAVYHMARVTPQPHVARAVLLAALRQKYGKETLAIGPAQRVVNDDAITYALWWVYDEQGNRVLNTQAQNASPFGCGSYMGSATNGYYMTVVRGTSGPIPSWCASSFVAVTAQIGPQPIIDVITLEMADIPLLVRTTRATAAWMKGAADQARQQQLERSQQVKPQL
jgi:hypothetical protein